MVLNSKSAMSFIKDPMGHAAPQQHGVDLTLANVVKVTPSEITKERSQIGVQTPLSVWMREDGKKMYDLPVGYYGIYFEQGIKLPNNVKANIVHRSSVLRGGAIITSGEYDPGFETEMMGAYMFVAVPIRLEIGARVAQVVLTQTQPCDEYDGQWQGK